MTPPDGRRGRASQPLSLKARAVALLAQREHSAMELRRKLLRIARDRQAEAGETPADSSAFPDEDESQGPSVEVDAVLDWLKANGYLDESRFVESRIHVRSQRFGQRRIEQELAQHGLSMDAEQRSTLAAGELERACELLRRKFGEGPAADAAALAKRLRFLVGRGFGSDLARRAVRRVAVGSDLEE
nr:regulatory protein RecX [uncultured Roseateles sp.]